MTDESSPQVTATPPISIVGHALLDAVQAALPAVHKSILLVQHDGYLVVAASHGASNENHLFGQTIPLGDGFVGWAAESGLPQVRANMQYVPPDLPQLTEVEGSLESKSGMTAPMDLPDGGFAEVAAYVCHGFQVFVLEDLDQLEHTCDNWTGRLGDAHQEEESIEWLEAQLPQPVETAPVAEEASQVAEEGLEADYTEQDMEVLLSVFGVDLTTRKGRLAQALKADVADVMQRDVKNVFKSPDAPGEWASAPPEIPDEPEEEPQGGSETPEEKTAPPAKDEHYSQEDVGRVLSVFGVKLSTGDSALSRALSQDVGAFLKKDPEKS